jgi:glutathione S-transferase
VITLYHGAPSRSAIVRWMLEEIGVPYEIRLIDFRKAEQRQPDYLAVNPMGKVPAIDHDGIVVTEAAAICAYLAEAFPESGLGVPIGDKRRGPYLKWLFFGPSCLEPAVIDRMLKREAKETGSLGYGDFDRTVDVVTKAVSAGPYLLGDQFTAADVVIGSGIRWGMNMTRTIPERPELLAYVQRLEERPALKRATAKDMELIAARQ